MHTVGRVDLQLFGSVVTDHFVDMCRAEACAGVVVFFHATACADIRLQDLQVDRLIFIVSRRGEID